MQVRGTVKAAVLNGDPECLDLIATSVPMTQASALLINVSRSNQVGGEGEKGLQPAWQMQKNVSFLRLNINDDSHKGRTFADLTIGYARPSGGGRFYFGERVCDFG